MTFAAIGIYANEIVTNDQPLALLTGPDTLEGMEVLQTGQFSAVFEASLLTATGAGLITDLMVINPFITGFVDENLPAGTAEGQLNHPDNLLIYQASNLREDTVANTYGRLEVNDIGIIENNDWNGPEINLIRERTGRLQAQYPQEDVRMFEASVAISQTNGAIAGMA